LDLICPMRLRSWLQRSGGHVKVKRHLLPLEKIERAIFWMRGHKVILDSDLAALYGVETRRLNEQVRRNGERFPADFAFQLNAREAADLRSQIATSSSGWGGRRKLPFVFTEHGALMAASVLNSPRAVQISLYVVRAFLRLRRWVVDQSELSVKLAELERRVAGHDQDLKAVVRAIRQLTTPPETPRRKIGFGSRDSR
jgi:hypothetical protein